MERIRKYFQQNKVLFLLIFVYTILVLLTLDFGIPNSSHPFTYHMDEWHQLMAVRSLFKHGTSNVEGAANGPILFFLLSGIFLGPFYILHIVDPFAIKSSVTNLVTQQHLFEALRLTSLLFGIGSIVFVWETAKRYLKISPMVTTGFFVCTPLFLMLSGYFKYDIALLFWTCAAFFSFFAFLEKPTIRRYCLAGVMIACSLATKISTLPFLPIFLLLIFLVPKVKRKITYVVWGFLSLALTFFLVGIPDSIFRAKAYYDFFYLNIVYGPTETANYILHQPYWVYLYTHVYPLSFGHGFYTLFVISLGFIVYQLFIRRGKKQTYLWILFLTFLLFFFSLVSIKIQAIGNRVLVIIPFMAFFIGVFYQKISVWKNKTVKNVVYVFFILAFGIQFFEVAAFMQMKLSPNPRSEASVWMRKHLQKQTIGLENIPIYQGIPDLPLLEFYSLGEHSKLSTRFIYQVIDKNTKTLPKTIIVTNPVYDSIFLKKSDKKDLLIRMHTEKYREIKRFNPSWQLFSLYADPIDEHFLGLVPLYTISFYQK